MPRFVSRLMTIWEAVQVELQGRYSLQRFKDLLAHAKSSSKLKNMAIVVLAPMPTLFVLLVLDALPMKSPYLGLAQQTPWFFFRLCIVCVLPPLVFPHNMHICNPQLSLSTPRRALIAVTVMMVFLLNFISLGKLWAFPTPFGFQLSIFPAMLIAFGLLYWSWKDQLEANPDVKTNAACYVQALMGQANLLSAYTAYYCAFTLAGKTYQPFVSFVLPILKMIFKNSIRKGLYFVEDLAQ